MKTKKEQFNYLNKSQAPTTAPIVPIEKSIYHLSTLRGGIRTGAANINIHAANLNAQQMNLITTFDTGSVPHDSNHTTLRYG